MFEKLLEEYLHARIPIIFQSISEIIGRKKSSSLSLSISLKINLKNFKKEENLLKKHQDESIKLSVDLNNNHEKVIIDSENLSEEEKKNQLLQNQQNKSNHSPKVSNNNDKLEITNNKQSNEEKNKILLINLINESKSLTKVSENNNKLDKIDNEIENKLFLNHPELFFSSDELQPLNIVNMIYKGKYWPNERNNFFELKKVKIINLSYHTFKEMFYLSTVAVT